MSETVTPIPAFAPPAELERVPLVTNQRSLGWISDQVAGIVEGKTPRWWWAVFIPSVLAFLVLPAMMLYQITTGVGVWGDAHPVMWGWDIINFVWWIGIGHAGTLISAILFLLRQRWRTAVNRAAEAMTIFAVMCASIYPALHVGRVWFDWWLFPIPTANALWPQFRSPLMWDVFAVSTYFTVSLLFWYIGSCPTGGDARPAKTKLRKIGYGCSRWAGAARTGIGATTRRRTSSWPGSRRRWCSRSTRSCRWTSPSRSFPAGIPPSSRLTSSPARSFPASAWC